MIDKILGKSIAEEAGAVAIVLTTLWAINQPITGGLLVIFWLLSLALVARKIVKARA